MNIYRSPLAFGICIDVDPHSKEATELLDILEPQIKNCNMPDCTEEAVAVGIYETPVRNSDSRFDSEFRGLCERHKTAGVYAKTWE